MSSNGFLHLLCGKMASGKSTPASALERSESGTLVVEDDLLQTLIDEIRWVALKNLVKTGR